MGIMGNTYLIRRDIVAYSIRNSYSPYKAKNSYQFLRVSTVVNPALGAVRNKRGNPNYVVRGKLILHHNLVTI